MDNFTGLTSTADLSQNDLKGKTIFIRVDFNVPMVQARQGFYRVDDDTRIRRFLDLTFKRIHELTDGDCRIIIGSHLGRPHVSKNHSGWDGIFNLQFVSSHFDTLIKQIYKDIYTVFPPELVDSQLQHSLEMIMKYQLPLGGIKFLPNLRYLLDPVNPEHHRKEFIEMLGHTSDVFINCAFGTCHRLTKSIELLPQLMHQEGKTVVAGDLLREELRQLGHFGKRILERPGKTVVIAGGAKISDKIGILKQFAQSKIFSLFLGGKMVNAFMIAEPHLDQPADAMQASVIPAKLRGASDADNEKLLKEIRMAHEILSLARQNNVNIRFPIDFKVVKDFKQSTFDLKGKPDFESELQLDLGPRTIESFTKFIRDNGIRNIFWNGPLGAYDHPASDAYAAGSLSLAKLLFACALGDKDMSVVVGGGDTAAILNKFNLDEMKALIDEQVRLQVHSQINRQMFGVDFKGRDCYELFNYFASNFFVSTGGGASLEFLEDFLQDGGNSPMAAYLPGTKILLPLQPAVSS